MDDEDVHFGDGVPTAKGRMHLDLYRMQFQGGMGMFELCRENGIMPEELFLMCTMEVLHTPPEGFAFDAPE